MIDPSPRDGTTHAMVVFPALLNLPENIVITSTVILNLSQTDNKQAKNMSSLLLQLYDDYWKNTQFSSVASLTRLASLSAWRVEEKTVNLSGPCSSKEQSVCTQMQTKPDIHSLERLEPKITLN